MGALEPAGVPCRYWLAGSGEPLESGAVRVAYMGGEDLAAFMGRCMTEGL